MDSFMMGVFLVAIGVVFLWNAGTVAEVLASMLGGGQRPSKWSRIVRGYYVYQTYCAGVIAIAIGLLMILIHIR